MIPITKKDEKESYKHYFAKMLFKQWFDDGMEIQYGYKEKYGLYILSRENTNILIECPLLFNAKNFEYEILDKKSLSPDYIADIALEYFYDVELSGIRGIIEIVHKHKTPIAKRVNIVSTKVTVNEISADWILSQIENPKRIQYRYCDDNDSEVSDLIEYPDFYKDYDEHYDDFTVIYQTKGKKKIKGGINARYGKL